MPKEFLEHETSEDMSHESPLGRNFLMWFVDISQNMTCHEENLRTFIVLRVSENELRNSSVEPLPPFLTKTLSTYRIKLETPK